MLSSGRNWDISVPGFGGDEYRAYKKTVMMQRLCSFTVFEIPKFETLSFSVCMELILVKQFMDEAHKQRLALVSNFRRI